jgi:hypothetical protein
MTFLDMTPHASMRLYLSARKSKCNTEALGLLLGLHVLVGTVGKGTANENDGVKADTEAGLVSLVLGVGGVGSRVGGRVTGLLRCQSLVMRARKGHRPDRVEVSSYLSLESADDQPVEGLASLVTVADILESLGGILTSDIEHDLLTTAAAC